VRTSWWMQSESAEVSRKWQKDPRFCFKRWVCLTSCATYRSVIACTCMYPCMLIWASQKPPAQFMDKTRVRGVCEVGAGPNDANMSLELAHLTLNSSVMT